MNFVKTNLVSKTLGLRNLVHKKFCQKKNCVQFELWSSSFRQKIILFNIKVKLIQIEKKKEKPCSATFTDKLNLKLLCQRLQVFINFDTKSPSLVYFNLFHH